MKSISISIIIPVSKDIKIKKCLSSIQNNPEIIIVLNNNPSQEVIDVVKDDKRCVPIFLDTAECNLAQVINTGVQKARNEKIIIMNSDCIFSEGILDKININLNNFDIIKAHISFLYDTFFESLVAKVKYLYNHIFNNKKNIFCPGLAFNRKIIKEVGGYLFDEDMGWGEDADLSRRIHEARLPYLFMEEEIVHLPESIRHDLGTAVRIGTGKRMRDYKNNISFLRGIKAMFFDIFLDRYRHLKLSLEHEGLIVTIYLFIWKIFFFLGYFHQKKTKTH